MTKRRSQSVCLSVRPVRPVQTANSEAEKIKVGICIYHRTYVTGGEKFECEMVSNEEKYIY